MAELRNVKANSHYWNMRYLLNSGELDKYFRFYNEERTHSLLDYKTPAEVYYSQDSQEQIATVNPVLVNI